MNVKGTYGGCVVYITQVMANPYTGLYDICYVNAVNDMKLDTVSIEVLNGTIMNAVTEIDGELL